MTHGDKDIILLFYIFHLKRSYSDYWGMIENIIALDSDIPGG